MANLLQQFAFAALFLFLSTNALAFQITRTSVTGLGANRPSSSISRTPPLNLFRNKRRIRPTMFMTEEANDPEEPEIETKDESNSNKKGDEVEEQRTWTVLLTVPLFCKFVVVLILKIAQDLVVYPLLFLYRLAGIVKRKFLSLIGSGGGRPEKTNGAT